MAAQKKKSRWLFVLIPLGFVVLVGIMLLAGQRSGGPVSNPYEGEGALEDSPSPEADPEVVNDPDDLQEPFVPSPSGPEFDDNQTVID